MDFQMLFRGRIGIKIQQDCGTPKSEVPMRRNGFRQECTMQNACGDGGKIQAEQKVAEGCQLDFLGLK